MSAKKIPPDIEPELLARAGRGESGDQLAAWLSETHGIEMSGRRVRAFLENIRRERSPIARAATVAAVSKTVGTDLAELEILAGEAREILTLAKGKQNFFAAVQAIQAEAKIRETRLKLSGAMEPDAPQGQRAATAVILLPPEKPIAVPQLPPPAQKPAGTT